MMNMHKMAMCAGVCTMAMVASDAVAQEVEDIVVTAQRREESLQRVPIAVSALGAEGLENRGITSADDISTFVTGLNATRHGAGPNFYLRGVGTNSGQIGLDQAVAIFIDGVYQPGISSGNFDLFDVERVEVLKGPQGTLFGRNATGGAISVITNAPKFTSQFKGEVGYGNYDTVEANAFANLAYTDNVAQTIAVSYRNQDDGYGTNVANGQQVARENVVSLRSKILLDLGQTRITLGGDYSKRNGDIGAIVRTASSMGWAFGFYDANSNVNQALDVQTYGGLLTVAHDFDFATLTSISAFRGVESFVRQEIDQTDLDLLQYEQTERTSQYTQELQLASAGDGPLQWTVGAFYLTGKFRAKPLYQYGGLIQFFVSDPTAYSLTGRNVQSLESLAAYAQSTFEFAERAHLTLGFRYTTDRRRIEGQDFKATFAGPDVPLAPPVIQKSTSSEPTWRIALDYEFADGIMGYASYNHGFKSGAYNFTAISDPELKPEKIDAFEAGVKTKLFSNAVRFNASGFLYTYNGLQLIKLDGQVQRLLNAAKAKIYGGEAELEIAASRRLSLNGNIGLLHAEFDEFEDAPVFGDGGAICGSDVCDLSGYRLPKAPKFTANASIDYRLPLAGGEAAFNVTYAYNSGFFWDASNRTRQEAYSLVNARIAWSAPEERYTITLWAKNLTNEKLIAYTQETALGDLAIAGVPRTYGVRLGMSF